MESNDTKWISIIFLIGVIGVACLLSVYVVDRVYGVEQKLVVVPAHVVNTEQELTPTHDYTVIHCPNPDCPNHTRRPYQSADGGTVSYKISTWSSGSHRYAELLCEFCGACWMQEVPIV